MIDDADHPELEDLLGAYALDAVDADEASRVESHLEGCPRCRAEVDADREVAGHLGTSTRVGDAEPLPEGLWDRIAGGLASGGGRASGPGAGRPEPVSVVDISAAGPNGRRRAGRWVSLVGAAAAVAAIAVLGVRLAQVDQQAPRSGQAAAVHAALLAPTHRLVHLKSASGTQLAEFVVLHDGQGYLVSSSMAALPGDETYQLWAVVDGRTISMGLLGHDPRQAAFTVASSAVPSELAVTVEPAGGVSAPDRRPVAAGPFT